MEIILWVAWGIVALYIIAVLWGVILAFMYEHFILTASIIFITIAIWSRIL